jgi:biopolymer transport protein ExbD
VLADTIMYPIYSDRSAAFDPQSRDLMLARLGRTSTAIVETTPAVAQHPVLAITVDAQGQLILGGRTLDDDSLDGLLQLSFKDDPDTEVVVKAAKTAPHAAVIKILDHAKAAGLKRMAIAVDAP